MEMPLFSNNVLKSELYHSLPAQYVDKWFYVCPGYTMLVCPAWFCFGGVVEVIVRQFLSTERMKEEQVLRVNYHSTSRLNYRKALQINSNEMKSYYNQIVTF